VFRIDQVRPFQDSPKAWGASELPEIPTAMQRDAEVHETLSGSPPFRAGVF
jgi:hypothetical protein